MAGMNHPKVNYLSIGTTESNQSGPALVVGNAGSEVKQIVSNKTSHDWASISANSFLEQSFVLPGASVNATVIAHVEDSLYSGTYRSINFEGRPSDTTGTVTVKASNVSAAAINMDALNFRVTAINF